MNGFVLVVAGEVPPTREHHNHEPEYAASLFTKYHQMKHKITFQEGSWRT
jgi:hypothetical protein